MTFVEKVRKFPWNLKLQVLRIEKGWGQREAADRCGTTQKQYWAWEKGLSYPTLNNRKAICAAYGVNMNEIFEEKKEVC
jgi:transcriptional regulator with XRE-family HTH domain